MLDAGERGSGLVDEREGARGRLGRRARRLDGVQRPERRPGEERPRDEQVVGIGVPGVEDDRGQAEQQGEVRLDGVTRARIEELAADLYERAAAAALG